MDKFLNRFSIIVIVITIILWSCIIAFGEEPAKNPDEIRKERYARCQRILRELFPSELRTDVNYFGILADEEILRNYDLEKADKIGRDFAAATQLYLEGYKLNEALFGENPDPNVDEKRFEECLNELNRLGNETRNGIEELMNHIPIANAWQGFGQHIPIDPPKNQRELNFLDQIIAPSIANRLLVLSERGLLKSEQMADADALGINFLHAAYLRFKTSHDIKNGVKESLETDMSALNLLLELIDQDEKKMRKVIFNLPISKRWKEVWEKK